MPLRSWTASHRILAAISALVLSAGAALAAPSADELADLLDEALAPAVADGRVDYVALKSNPGPLDKYLQQIESIPKVHVLGWDKADVRAFYINAYNAHTLRIVRDRYPIKTTNENFPIGSIQQIPDVWDMPLTVAQEKLSLNGIEKGILLGEHELHQAHFAVNCASIGCPELAEKAYRGETLGRDLNLATQAFIRGPHGAQVDEKAGVVRLSKIFEWYWADFKKLKGTPQVLTEVFADTGPMLAFVAAFLPKEEGDFVRAGDYRVEYMEYDWGLNSK